MSETKMEISSRAGWPIKQGQVVISHPGMELRFPASHHNALKLFQFGAECVAELEAKALQQQRMMEISAELDRL